MIARWAVTAAILLLAAPASAGWYAVAGWQPLSDAGAVLASGTLTFSRTGTSTAKNIYSDRALTSALSNPLTLDAAGRVTTNIWMLEDECYRAVLKNSAGTTIWTRDEQCALSESVAEVTRRRSIVRSPMDHGAAGDGSTNDYTAVDAALDVIDAAGGGVLDLDGNTYRVDSTLALRANLTIRNGKLDFTNSASTEYLSCQGTIGSAVLLSANASVGDPSISSNTISGISEDDWLFVYSTQAWNGDSDDVGELVQVASASGSTISLRNELFGAYATASGASYKEVSLVENVTLQDLEIIGLDSAAGSVSSVYLERCGRVQLQNVYVNEFDVYGVQMRMSVGVTIRDSVFEDGGTYGIDVAAASTDVRIDGCTFSDAVRGVRIGEPDVNFGIARFVSVRNSVMVRTTIGVEAVSTAQHISIAGNSIHGALTTGISVLGADIDILDNVIDGPSGDGISVTSDVSSTDPGAWSVRVIGNRIDNADDDGISAAPTTALGLLEVSSNLVKNVGTTSTGSGIEISLSSTADDINVRGNTVDTAVADGITVTGAGSASRISVSDNSLFDFRVSSASGGFGIDVQLDGRTTIARNKIAVTQAGASDVIGIRIFNQSANVVEGNEVDSSVAGMTVEGIWIVDSHPSVITGNVITDFDTGILYQNNGAASNEAVTIAGNITRDCGNGISVVGTTNALTGASVVGNTIEGVNDTSNYGINIQGIIAGGVVSGNTVERDDDNDSGIRLSGTSAGDIDGVIVSGNSIRNGSFGVRLLNCDQTCRADNNVLDGCTADYGGLELDGENDVRILRFTFDPSTDVSLRATATHSMAEVLPDNAVVVRGYYRVTTTFTSAADTATISIGIPTDDVAGFVAAIAINDGSNPWDAGWHEMIQTGTAASFSEAATAQRAINITVAVQALTAGKLIGWLEYVIQD